MFIEVALNMGNFRDESRDALVAACFHRAVRNLIYPATMRNETDWAGIIYHYYRD